MRPSAGSIDYLSLLRFGSRFSLYTNGEMGKNEKKDGF
uniref:Uncharacterized protein n=1 Tax=Arundo donax TaxID=35708 RepID=A0A0A9SB95_ARUDO